MVVLYWHELSCGAMCFSSSAILTSGFRMYKETCLVAAKKMMNLCPILLHVYTLVVATVMGVPRLSIARGKPVFVKFTSAVRPGLQRNL